MYKVHLTYFKETGKYYSDGTYDSNEEHLFDIFSEVRQKVYEGKVPGMVEGYKPKYTLIDVPDHPNSHPKLIIHEGNFETANRFPYKAEWSKEDQEYVGTCREFPSLSFLAPTQIEALIGIRNVVQDVYDDKIDPNHTTVGRTAHLNLNNVELKGEPSEHTPGDPIHQDPKTSLWYFWNEVWSETTGPFETRKEAEQACAEYCKTLYWKLPRTNSFVRFCGKPEYLCECLKPYLDEKGGKFIFLGEIPNMPGHCILTAQDGKVHIGHHSDHFEEIPEEEV